MGESSMDKPSRIYVAGHGGLVGSAICRRLRQEGYSNLIVRARKELDLFERPAVDAFFAAEKPEYVFLAAAKVGGILANSTYPVEFLRDNLSIEINVLDAAYRYGVKKIEILGSSCIYPRLAPQPIKEEYLLTGPLEPTNEWYAIAKIAGIKLAQAYQQQYGFRAISLMPTESLRTWRSTSISMHRTCCRRCCAKRMRRAPATRRRWWCGAAAIRAASSCTWTIWRTRRYF